MASKASLTAFLAVLALAALAQAQTFTTLYDFTGGSDGYWPDAGVIQGPAGNLYGTAGEGGDLSCYQWYGCGVVYKLDSAGIETVLYAFAGSPDGDGPVGPVVRDRAGNIYGTTYTGGTSSNCRYGCGTVFKIDAAGNETLLYSFTGGSDGCYPDQGLVADKSGNLYGTAYQCGSSNNGTIFKVDSAGNFTLLHSFTGSPSDGAWPDNGHLTMDKTGTIYGVTEFGGTNNLGTLYKLSESGTLTLLHSFGGSSDGCYPGGSVVLDEAGNLYGTTWGCPHRRTRNGTIWKVSKKDKETTLHTFAGGTSDGCYPAAGVTPDSEGNLYGVTQGCGANNRGTLYELSASGTFALLHSFDRQDNTSPVGEVLWTTNGTLFGPSRFGGSTNCQYGCGTVWSYVP